jgi:threonine/homoserine/homoserine lactone efflux protein
MTSAQFLFAVLALLLTPGPTNTLLAVSGAAVGLRRSLRIIPAETAGYLLVVVPLALFGGGLLDAAPQLGTAVKLGAAAWVLFLAVKLWRPAKTDAPDALVTPGRVLATTLLNPKGLIFGLVLLPRAGKPDFGLHLALFCASLLVVAVIWVVAGSMLSRDRLEFGLPQLVHRLAACWLAVLSLGLLFGTLSA